MVAVRSAVDWDAMEPEWRAGIKSKKELAAEYKVSRAAIDKHWAKLGIERDLSAKIKQEADALVARAAVAPEVTPEARATERQLVEANAAAQAQVRIAHRKTIQRLIAVCEKLLAELETCPDDLVKRTGILKSLADTSKTLITLERQAHGIADTVEPEDTAPIVTNPREIARRIAHALSIGLRAKEAMPIPGTPPQQQQWAH